MSMVKSQSLLIIQFSNLKTHKYLRTKTRSPKIQINLRWSGSMHGWQKQSELKIFSQASVTSLLMNSFYYKTNSGLRQTFTNKTEKSKKKSLQKRQQKRQSSSNKQKKSLKKNKMKRIALVRMMKMSLYLRSRIHRASTS